MTKIFQSFNGNNKPGLDFREFALCLAVCTKDKVKDRIRAILNTYKDKEDFVSFEDFEKLIKNIGAISDDKIFKEKKV